MTTIDVELLGPQGNVSVVQMPGRAFPAIAIQGDTFSTLWETARDAAALVSDARDDDAREELTELLVRLDEILAWYEATLRRHGIEVPFTRDRRLPPL